MGRPRISAQQKLKAALAELHGVLGSELGVIRGPEIRAATRRLLQERGYLREILKGWYFVADPSSAEGDTTPFYVNFWEYLARYLDERFGSDYVLTPEHSLLRHARYTAIPKSVNVTVPSSLTQHVKLPYDHSLMIYPGNTLYFDQTYQIRVDTLRCLRPAVSLVALPPRYYEAHAREIQIVMQQIDDPAELAALHDLNASGLARLLAAYRSVGRDEMTEAVLQRLKGVGIDLRIEGNPFAQGRIYALGEPGRAPLYYRVRGLWEQHRESVAALRPTEPTLTISPADYLCRVEALRTQDTYHSLSIERYRVTPELIERVGREGGWDPDSNLADRQEIDAMAAKGYLDAFEEVKRAASEAYAAGNTPGNPAAKLFEQGHHAWFQKLFGPSEQAGILSRAELMGYRRHMVFLRGSLHSPPHYDHVRDGMLALAECFKAEPDAFVRAVLGHWLFGFIHPYMDGNGRMARFTMNLFLASGGYPWTVIRVEDRDQYMQALETASVADDLSVFARFIAERIVQSA
nr:Fic family protein [Zoogloeaceae bacterium]